MSTIMNITSTTDDRVKNEDNKTEHSIANSAHVSTKRKGFFSRKNAINSSNESHSVDESAVKTETVSKKSSVKQSAKQQQSHQLLQTSQPNADQTDERFDGDGVVFNAKLIGHEFVAEARGEHMCQQSLKKLKILQRGLGGHKRRIQIFISFEGIKIRDAIASELLYHHSVPQISFISRDETDPRAFGYVFGSTTTGHQFIAIKTQKEAMPIMSAIGQLFAATLLRKKTEPSSDENNVEIKRDDTVDSEEKTRRESSITLRPSRSDSPNVPSMPAPPPPTNATNSSAEEHDFFAAFEPISVDTDFESDWKVNKEQLEQISNSCDVIANDPFASSFGSLSLSSGDWANFDDDNVSANNASPLQRSHDSSNANAKIIGVANTNSFVAIPNPPKTTKIDMPSSFNDSSSSMALNELFASGHHNSPFNQNSLASFNATNTPPISNFNSEAVAIPARVSPKDGQQLSNNQSIGSTTSSADRYACFAEIHSISSSIFDSLCDQIGEESANEFNPNSYSASKSLNSSLNGGFGNQHHLSSSYNGNNGNYFSFENPLSNSRNVASNAQQFSNAFNAENTIWNNSNMVSVSPSDKSNMNSQWSSTSSPSVSANIFANNNRINDFSGEAPIFAELDPLGKDKPFVDKRQFFADQKFKPTLKDLNNDLSFNESCDGSSITSASIPSVALSWKTVNPFNDSGNSFLQESVSAERYSPNPKPFNPFNTCDSQMIRTTPPPPIPPPRPPSRECPPVPPRTDLANANTIGAPPLPRRRISLEKQQIYDQRPIYTNTHVSRQWSADSHSHSPPPIPNPQRRPSKKSAANWDPFNCAFVESQLWSMSSSKNEKNAALINCDNQTNVSTPKSNVNKATLPPLRSQLKLSTISSPNNWSAISSSVLDNTVFEDNFNDIKHTTNLETQTSSDSNVCSINSINHSNSSNAANNHVSPPERNIFIAKSDPFEDEFFA